MTSRLRIKIRVRKKKPDNDLESFGIYDIKEPKKNQDEVTDETPMPFGKYKDDRMDEVPAEYLLWLYDNDKARNLVEYIEDNMDVLQQEADEGAE